MMRKHAQTADDDGRTFCKRWIFTVKKAVIKVSEPISLRRMFYSMQESGQILLFVKQRGASPILLFQTAGKTKVQIAGINRRQGGAAPRAGCRGVPCRKRASCDTASGHRRCPAALINTYPGGKTDDGKTAIYQTGTGTSGVCDRRCASYLNFFVCESR